MSKFMSFSESKQNLNNIEVNERFAESIGYVFIALLLSAVGGLVAATLNLYFIPFWLDLIVSFGLLYLMSSNVERGNERSAEIAFYLFSFWTGITIFGCLAACSIILGPQMVALVVGSALAFSALIMAVSVYVFAVRSNQALAEKYMGQVYAYGLIAIIGLIVFSFFINPANFAAMGMVYGFVGALIFSVMLFFDTFRAAYMDKADSPLLIATTIFLDIMNIVIHTLLLVTAAKTEKSDSAWDSVKTIATAIFGLLLPICFGVWLVYDYFTNTSDAKQAPSSGYADSTPSSQFSNRNDRSRPDAIPLVTATPVKENDGSRYSFSGEL